MTTNNDALREALLKYATDNPGAYIVPGWDGDSVRRALAASKPEPQAQAGEPEVVYFCEGKQLITLQSHREAMAEKDARLTELGIAIESWKGLDFLRNTAIAKKDAALKACVEAMKDAATSLETISRLAGKAVYVGDDGERIPTFMEHHDEVRGYAASRSAVARAAITQTQEAMK